MQMNTINYNTGSNSKGLVVAGSYNEHGINESVRCLLDAISKRNNTIRQIARQLATEQQGEEKELLLQAIQKACEQNNHDMQTLLQHG
jgi:hypothetical protein